jgi:hypothetical protein
MILDLFARSVLISLLAFGGGQAALPLIERIAVGETGWASPQDFATAVAFGYVTPGPVLITMTFLGYRAAGLRRCVGGHARNFSDAVGAGRGGCANTQKVDAASVVAKLWARSCSSGGGPARSYGATSCAACFLRGLAVCRRRSGCSGVGAVDENPSHCAPCRRNDCWGGVRASGQVKSLPHIPTLSH